jgi:hypothetical protein
VIHITAPFTGTLIGMPDRADRIAFIRTVIELTREGEFEPTTRVFPHGDTLLVNLSWEQIEAVRVAIEATREQEMLLIRQSEPAHRPQQRPIPDETRALIRERLAAGATPTQVAREVGRAYSSVYYFVTKMRRESRA